jgi:hypothetical protein
MNDSLIKKRQLSLKFGSAPKKIVLSQEELILNILITMTALFTGSN